MQRPVERRRHDDRDHDTRTTRSEARAAISSADPLLGGTLALMSFYARTQHAGAAQKIARNLAVLAQHPDLPIPLQTICRRLFGDWVREAEEAMAPRPSPADLHEEPPTMQ